MRKINDAGRLSAITVHFTFIKNNTTKVKKSLLEILDESGTELLEEIENGEDNGPIAEWGLWYRNPSEKSIDEAKKSSRSACCWFG